MKEKLEVTFKTETLAYLPVFANMQQLNNVMANLVVTSNQLGCNNDCYNKFFRNSFYDKAGLKRCYDKAGRN